MIQIITNPSFLPEKEYTFHVICKEILGIDYTITTDITAKNYTCILPNGGKIEFQDAFFSKMDETTGYCSISNIPSEILKTQIEILDEEIPIIYGDSEYSITNSNIYCGIDIVASAFFMLSRWEEIAITEKDSEQRFPENNSLAVTHNFIAIPLVHIYAELIRAFSKRCNFDIPSKLSFTVTASHDIDFMFKWNSVFDWLKTIIGDVITRKSLYLAFKNFKNYFAQSDPYNTFSILLDSSKRNNSKLFFYFLHTTRNEKTISSKKGKTIIQFILQNNHTIGIHSNVCFENDIDTCKHDIQYFESIFKKPIYVNRQHFLRFKMPETFRMLESQGIKQDSSLYYRNYLGFRTGMCIEHSVFDCEQRKTLTIKELPLILMDVTLQTLPESEIKENIDSLVAITKKYNGNFVYLWHNSSFDTYEWKHISKWYYYIQQIK